MQLAQLLHSKDIDTASEMLSAKPSLAWIRDDESGGYPLHIAVWHVRTFPLLLDCPSHLMHVKYPFNGSTCSYWHRASIQPILEAPLHVLTLSACTLSTCHCPMLCIVK